MSINKNNTPYLVIFRQFIPKPGVDTRKKGWAADGLESVERFEIVDRIANRHDREAMVIIQLLDMKMIKNGSGLDSAVLLAHYGRKYADDIAHGVDVWLARNGKTSTNENTDAG